jgi:glyoxylase-like metal-dependent hydrolase (beta-lactamase superfamily II)
VPSSHQKIEKSMKSTLSLLVFTFFVLTSNAKSNYFLKCWNKQVKPLKDNHLVFNFKETSKELNHDFYPWKETVYESNGQIWINRLNFCKSDTLKSGSKTFYSKTQYNTETLLFLDYGDEKLMEITQTMFSGQLVKSSRYSPLLLLNFFKENEAKCTLKTNENAAIFTQIINQLIVELWIDKNTFLLQKIKIISADDLYGDVVTNFNYSNYIQFNKVFVAKNIDIDRIDTKIKENVQLSEISVTKNVPILLEKPTDYQIKPDVVTSPEIAIEKYSPNIHLIDLKHTDDKVLLVEFKDFLLIAEAPLNVENGELIIAEARKIAPNKPIKYFVFGHHHPHYLGGLRAFVNEDVTVLSAPSTIPYLEYIAQAPHSIKPDKLQLSRKKLKTEAISTEKTITDGDFEMKIYFIGEKSNHTNDYLIYYFPKEKLLFEDDLVWISKSGELKKASKRQAGLYQAIMDLGLEVDTIIQSWPVADYGVKTVIPFVDLEKSVKM